MGFITNSADEVKAMNNLGGGFPKDVPFYGPSIAVNENATVYVDLQGNGDDDAEGREEAPWATLQRAFDAIPDGYAGDFVVMLSAGDVSEPAILRSLVDANSARICVVGDNSGGFDISGQSFAFATNATATATVAPFTDFARGDRWLEPGSYPVPDLFGTPEFAGTTLEASVGGTTLVATMGDPSVGDAAVGVRPYNTTMTASFVGTTQPAVNLQLVGIDFGSGSITREGCIFVACKITAATGLQALSGCGGFLTILGGGGFFVRATNSSSNAWSTMCGSYENSLIVSGNVNPVVLSTAVGDLTGLNSMLVGNNASVSMNFCDMLSGRGLLVGANSNGTITGFVDFVGNRAITAEDNSGVTITGSGYTGSVVDGIVAETSSRVDGKGALSSVTASGTEVTAGTATGTFAGADVVDAGAALCACT